MAYSPLSSLGGSSSGGDHFDRDQPRIPAGQSGGGRWTRIGALLSGRDIDLQGEEKFGGSDQPGTSNLPPDAARLAFSNGSETNTTWQKMPARSLFKPIIVHPNQAFEQFERYSALNGPDGQAVLELERREPPSFLFSRRDTERFVFTHATVKRLTREEVEKRCNQFRTVQTLLNDTYDEVTANNPGLNRGEIGRLMHLAMEHKINGIGNVNLRGVVIDRDRIYAERNFKSGEPEPDDVHVNRGQKGSRRPDAVEKSVGPDVENSYGAAVQRLRPDTACIYQHSIGQKNMGLTDTISLAEVMERAFRDNNFKHVVVTQMRPESWRPRR